MNTLSLEEMKEKCTPEDRKKLSMTHAMYGLAAARAEFDRMVRVPAEPIEPESAPKKPVVKKKKA